ncbi:MAG: thioredoxin family protein [Bacteroidales bacterium]
MHVKVLGVGCARCKRLARMVEEALRELKIDATLSKVEDIREIMAYGVMQTPALVIDENLVLVGRLPGKQELQRILSPIRWTSPYNLP